MAVGLGVLRLPPCDFWAMTPREIACALGVAGERTDAPGRADLAALMRMFPDRQA